MSKKRRIIITIISVLIIITIAYTIMTRKNQYATERNDSSIEKATESSDRNPFSKKDAPVEEEIEEKNLLAEDTVEREDKAVDENNESFEENLEKIITKTSLSIETKTFDDSVSNLNQLVNKHKGYIEYSEIYYNNLRDNKKLKSAQYAIKIPEKNTNNFIDEANKIGNTVSQSTSKLDVSKEYLDTKSKIKVLETKEKRILNLLEKANKIEDILKLEDELNNTINEKEGLIGNIKYMDDKVSYSTVYLDISEVDKYTAKETPEDPNETKFGQKIKNAFNDSIYYIKLVFQNLIIVLIYILPYALIGFLIYFIINQIRKKK